MKHVIFLTILMLATSYAKAQDRQSRILELAEKNLQMTLANGSDMLKESAMEAVVDIRRSLGAEQGRTVIPLMAILRNHQDPSLRILAAFTLTELKNDRGLFAIQEAARFDRNKTVRHICASLTHANM